MTAEETRAFFNSVTALLQKGWAKGFKARNAQGEKAEPTSKDACRWCLIGALEKSFSDLNLPSTEKAKVVNNFEEVLNAKLWPRVMSEGGFFLSIFNDIQLNVDPILHLVSVTKARMEANATTNSQ